MNYVTFDQANYLKEPLRYHNDTVRQDWRIQWEFEGAFQTIHDAKYPLRGQSFINGEPTARRFERWDLQGWLRLDR